MPTYTFRNKKTDEVFDSIMSWNTREEFLKINPDLEPIIGSPSIGDSVRLGIKSLYYQRSANPSQELARNILSCSSCEA